jgi:RhtB (resistance to homoserine/threonine) family protein
MQFWQGFITITLIHLLAAASPGPDFALVSRQTLLQGRRAGFGVSLGVALGLSIHLAYSAAGLAALVAHSTPWMTAIKLGGGGYLLYLGIQGLRAKTRPTSDGLIPATPTDASIWQLIRKGFLCNALNPKAPIYFLSLFTLVLSPDLPLGTLAIYGIWIMCLQLFWFSLITLFFSQPLIRTRFLKFSRWIDRLFGAAMIGLGLKVLLSPND